jgi:hypothetical protein
MDAYILIVVDDFARPQEASAPELKDHDRTWDVLPRSQRGLTPLVNSPDDAAVTNQAALSGYLSTHKVRNYIQASIADTYAELGRVRSAVRLIAATSVVSMLALIIGTAVLFCRRHWAFCSHPGQLVTCLSSVMIADVYRSHPCVPLDAAFHRLVVVELLLPPGTNFWTLLRVIIAACRCAAHRGSYTWRLRQLHRQ